MMIRHANIDDWEDIVRIEQENFTEEEALSPQELKRRIELFKETFLVAEIDHHVVGFLVGNAVDQRYLTDELFQTVPTSLSQGGFIIITSLSIDSSYQGQGIGTALLAVMKDLVVSQNRYGISLTCHDYLISYYEMNDFKDEGVSQSSYAGGVWYNMVWENPFVSL